MFDKKLHISYNVVIVYGTAKEADRIAFLTELGDICGDQDIHLLVGGDFNILRFAADKNKRLKRSRKIDMFNSIINTHELREISLSGGQYTWSNNHSDPTLEKLDRILVSSDWDNLFPSMTVRKLVRELSDHNSLLLDTMEVGGKKRRDFRFDVGWCKQPAFFLES